MLIFFFLYFENAVVRVVRNGHCMNGFVWDMPNEKLNWLNVDYVI